jgi:phage portal protein BeeE
MFIKAIDEDIRSQRFIDYVASSTMQIEHDQFDVTGYVQMFAGKQARFKPNEIVHVPLHRIDGKVDGFSPVESLSFEMILIWAIKENMLSFFRNGGSPKKMFILPDEISNSPNHKWLVNMLMDKGALQNRHGNLILTGNIDVQDLEKNPQDMEYKELALYLTGNIAYALRVPVNRIPYLIGSAASSSDGGGMAEAGYWSMINSDQLTIEQHLNQQIFSKLGFKFKFKRHYKIDALREAQATQGRMDAITKARTELNNAGLKINKTKLLALLSGNDFNISITDVEEMTPEEKMGLSGDSGLLNKSFVANNQVNSSPDKVEMNATKRKATQNVQPENQ